MSQVIAALPMYDWPEVRDETDTQWAAIRARLAAAGIEAPEGLVRRNADMPAVPGGIRDTAGTVMAPDPASLPPDELDPHTLWRHPALIFGQTCWGPMELGLQEHVVVVGQPDYSAFEGGEGELYSSVILMRKSSSRSRAEAQFSDPLPVEIMRGARFAFNGPDSMSGIIALTRDLATQSERIDLFGERIETGGHRQSIRAVAEGRADVCAIDCRSWALAQRFEPAARDLTPVGWTARRKGLPYITSRAHRDLAETIARALTDRD